MTEIKRKSAMNGVKIVSFCWVAAGPLTFKYFAQFGATVVRVESHTRLDVVRTSGPFKDGLVHYDNSATFANYNSSVLSVTLNLKKPGGLNLVWKLIDWADIVGEGFGPGTMHKLGLDYESVKKRKPDIIYFSTSQLGQVGPYSKFVGFGWQAAAMAGFTSITGLPDRAPVPYHGAYTDFIAARFGALAVMAALEYRRRTGRGQYIDQSQLESSCQVLAPPIMDYFVNGRVLERHGNRVDFSVPHGVFRCKGDDRWVAIAVSTDEEWRRFCKTIGKTEWIDDPHFSTFVARKKNEGELEELITRWTSQHTAEEVENVLQGAGIAAGVVETVKDLLEDLQLKYRGYFRKYKHTFMGESTYRGPSFRLSKVPDSQFAGPALGEHNEYVFKELLHLSDDEVAEALIDGSVTTEADLPAKGGGIF